MFIPRLQAIVCSILIIFALMCFGNPAVASATPLKIATWNIENLSQNADKNFVLLRDYAEDLEADIVALQEVDGSEAAKKIFDDDVYNFFFSSRNHPQRTGFAVKKGISVKQNPDFTELDVGDVRRGTDITVSIGDYDIRMLSVHLKSFCFDNDLDGNVTGGCIKLKRQLPILESWIDRRASDNQPFAVLGDFNRRLNKLGDDFWEEIDDGQPTNADLVKATEDRRSICFDGQYPDFIDHIVLDKQAAQWLDLTSFEQPDFGIPIEEQPTASDHCAIAVRLDVEDKGDVGDISNNATFKVEVNNHLNNIIQEIEAIKELMR